MKKRRLACTLIIAVWAMLGMTQSDKESIALADKVMVAMGGEDNWDNTQYLEWTFFGRRNWIWDKWNGRVRVEMPGSETRIAMNIHDMTGQVWAHGEVQTHKDSIAKYMDMGYKAWINDSYWLVMPFKLRDPGVTLKYLGEMAGDSVTRCEVVEMTFSEVGVTPDNKYLVYVDPATDLVVQWDFYSKYSDTEPRITTPWNDYQQYGDILLSGNRGRGKLEGIAVYAELPDALFEVVEKPAKELK